MSEGGSDTHQLHLLTGWVSQGLNPSYALRERGLLFVGIDVIDGNLTEINVTSPTGIRAIARLGGPDVAAKIWDVIEKKRGRASPVPLMFLPLPPVSATFRCARGRAWFSGFPR